MAQKCIKAGAFCLSKTGGRLVKIPGRSEEKKHEYWLYGLTTALSERIVFNTGHVLVIPVVFSAAVVTPVGGVCTHTYTLY